MIVKVCGITNGDDARAAAEAGATALGFNFYPGSPRYLTLDAAHRLREQIPSNILKVGVFVNEKVSYLVQVARELELDVIQIHGDAAEAPSGLRVWRGLRAAPGFHIGQLDQIEAEACLLDTPAPGLHGGTGQTFDWSIARGARRHVILAGGLDETNVRRAIEAAAPWGVDACSRLESAPGRKDHQKMALFIKAALS